MILEIVCEVREEEKSKGRAVKSGQDRTGREATWKGGRRTYIAEPFFKIVHLKYVS